MDEDLNEVDLNIAIGNYGQNGELYDEGVSQGPASVCNAETTDRLQHKRELTTQPLPHEPCNTKSPNKQRLQPSPIK